MIKVNKRLHKTIYVLIFTLFCIYKSSVTSYAIEYDSINTDAQINGIIGEFESNVPDGFFTNGTLDEVGDKLGVKSILTHVIASLREGNGDLAALVLSVLGASLLGCLSSFSGGELSPFVSRSLGVITAGMLFERLIFLADGVRTSLSEVSSFFGAVIPITLAVNSVGASPTTASAQALGMGITLGVYSYICSGLLSFVAVAIFVFSAASAIDPAFGGIARWLRNAFLTLTGFLTALISATFSLQSVITSSADSTIVRGAKYAISSTVPIVGSTVSGALGVLSGGVSYARSIVGGGAIAVILSLILAPLITLLLYRACLSFGSFLFGICSGMGCEGVIASFSTAIDVLIAVYSLTSVVYIVELVAFLKGGASFA